MPWPVALSGLTEFDQLAAWRCLELHVQVPEFFTRDGARLGDLVRVREGRFTQFQVEQTTPKL